MKIINKKLIISIALIILTTLILTSNVFAVSDPSYYNPDPAVSGGSFLLKAEKVLGLIQFIGIIVSVIAIAVIGLKYMLSSVEGKAEYKKTMLPYVVGCFMLMGTCLIVEIIEQIAKV